MKQETSTAATVYDEIEWNLYKSGTYYLHGDIDDHSVADCIKWILSENATGRCSELKLVINSCGGDLYQAFGLIDIMKSIGSLEFY
jgi:ATP-dependent protease ClpP protease subunit